MLVGVAPRRICDPAEVKVTSACQSQPIGDTPGLRGGRSAHVTYHLPQGRGGRRDPWFAAPLLCTQITNIILMQVV